MSDTEMGRLARANGTEPESLEIERIRAKLRPGFMLSARKKAALRALLEQLIEEAA